MRNASIGALRSKSWFDTEGLKITATTHSVINVPKVAISCDKRRLDGAERLGADAFHSNPATLEGHLKIVGTSASFTSRNRQNCIENVSLLGEKFIQSDPL